MNLEKLFKTQQILRDRINYNESDRFEKLILALLVELGECANCWRGFKFWSKDQEPRTSMNTCDHCNRLGRKACIGCYGKLYKNPLLEEYVDGLHFILELGIEIDVPYHEWLYRGRLRNDIVDKFTDVFEVVMDFENDREASDWVNLFEHYLGLGEMLGFTWDEIEQAYYKKNKINHQRQEEGY